jgi:hypothetical protein
VSLRSAAEEVRLTHEGAGLLRLTRSVLDEHRRTWPAESTWAADGELRLRLVVDGSLLEVHAAGGPTFTERWHPSARRELVVGSTHPDQVEVTVHRLRPAVG